MKRERQRSNEREHAPRPAQSLQGIARRPPPYGIDDSDLPTSRLPFGGSVPLAPLRATPPAIAPTAAATAAGLPTGPLTAATASATSAIAAAPPPVATAFDAILASILGSDARQQLDPDEGDPQ